MIILYVFILVISFFYLMYVSNAINIKVEIRNLKIMFPKINNSIINSESEILFNIYILGKIKIYQKNLKKIDVKSKKNRDRLERLRKNENLKLDENLFILLRRLKYKINKMQLDIYLGTKDAALTAMAIGIISSLIGIAIRNKIKSYKKTSYKVIPIYEDINKVKINLDCIIELDIADIIHIIEFLKKGRVRENDRTSNRRTYAYSDE